MMKARRMGVAGIAWATVATLACTPALAQVKNPDRNAYFGETHLHTSWSADAWLFGNQITGPADAYKYAKGETIKHPLGYNIKIDTPMDFMGVTDHSEYVGITKMANTPGSPVSKLPETQGLIITDPNSKEQQQRAFVSLVRLMSQPPVKALMTPEITGPIWKENVQIADAANQPGKFTAFCSYEWTSQFDNRNLHRNIFFRDCAKVPIAPFSALDSWHPEELWQWMDGQRKAGNELLAISHNANLSDGWMYPTDLDSLGRPIDAAWAESRMRNERLIEIKQIKGQSETHPLLSPNDEFANYEINSYLLGLPPDSGRINKLVGSYARQALKDGLAMQDTRGYNPYKFGFGAAADSHNTGTPYRQNNFFGGHGQEDGTVQTRMSGHNFAGIDVRLLNPAGLTGVWAEENTRAAIWDAMYRKETFGVSGPHIKVRFFGGWDFGKGLLNGKDWVKRSYAGGVPMGGDLPPDEDQGADVRGVGGEGPDLRQSRSHRDRQGLDQERPELREDLRRGLVRRPQAGQVDRADSRDPEHGRHRQGHVHEHGGFGRAEDGVDRSRFRSQPARVLLRPRAGNPHAALDHDPGEAAGHRAAGRGAGDRAGARLELADLVHAERRGAQGRSAGDDGRGSDAEGRCRPRRGPAQAAARREGRLGAQHRDGGAVPGQLQLRTARASSITWAGMRPCRASRATSCGAGIKASPRRTRSRTAKW